MGGKSRKRARDSGKDQNNGEVPVKRQRQINEDQLKLAKLYEDLAAESDNVRFEAAKQLIVKFSPENNPTAKDVHNALSRLIKGLCSQRKAARVGFSLTLTELLREIFGPKRNLIEGLELDVAALINLIEEKTKVEGNVPGRVSDLVSAQKTSFTYIAKERRDHLIGRLFGYKAVLQSFIVINPDLSMECWSQLLDHIYGMARDIPWLREECGMVLVEAAKSLQGQAQYENCAKEMISRLGTFKLVSTPEGVAIWLTVQSSYGQVLPEGIWHAKDPLSKQERTRLARILKESYQGVQEDGSSDAVKTAAANPNPTFVWNMVLNEILSRDKQSGLGKQESPKVTFPQFWLDTVDSRYKICITITVTNSLQIIFSLPLLRMSEKRGASSY